MKKATLLLMLVLAAFWGCEEDVVDDTVTYDSFDIQQVASRATAADANAEIIRMVPGTNDKAIFVASAVNQLFVVTYSANNLTFSEPYNLDTGSSTAEMTSIDVTPEIDGENYAMVCVAETDCARGSVLFVKISDGTIVSRVDSIGYNPDGGAFTKDGNWVIIACEDDREDRTCKPADRWGGSVSIIDLRNGVANATLAQDYLVNYAEDSEPEHAETNANGDVIVSVQEVSDVLVFNVNDLPLTEQNVTRIHLPNDAGDNPCQPDGMFISPDGTTALFSNEKNGTFLLMDMASKTLLNTPYIIENDLPEGWQRDARKSTKRTEPEEATMVEKDGQLYALFALQEAHAVIVYNVTDPANPVFDSIAEAGIDWANDNSMEKSSIGPEGLSAHPTNGMVLSANERESTVTLYSASWARE